MAQYLKSKLHFLQYLGFNSRDVPESSNLIFQTQIVGNYQLYWCCLCKSLGRRHLHSVGKGRVRAYLRSMAELNIDILRGQEKSGCGLETISFPTIVTKAASRGCGMCCVCLRDDRKKFCQLFTMCVQGPHWQIIQVTSKSCKGQS